MVGLEGGASVDDHRRARHIRRLLGDDPRHDGGYRVETSQPAERHLRSEMLWLTEKTVETHVHSILGKLDLSQDGDTHRRVLAVVTYLQASAA